MKRKRCKPLTKEQKKLIWKEPESNAGLGWEPQHGQPADPEVYEHGGPDKDDQ